MDGLLATLSVLALASSACLILAGDRMRRAPATGERASAILLLALWAYGLGTWGIVSVVRDVATSAGLFDAFAVKIVILASAFVLHAAGLAMLGYSLFLMRGTHAYLPLVFLYAALAMGLTTYTVLAYGGPLRIGPARTFLALDPPMPWSLAIAIIVSLTLPRLVALPLLLYALWMARSGATARRISLILVADVCWITAIVSTIVSYNVASAANDIVGRVLFIAMGPLALAAYGSSRPAPAPAAA